MRCTVGFRAGLALAVAGSMAATPTGDVPTFVEVTRHAGIAFTHATAAPVIGEPELMTPGVAAADFNRDGWIDLFVQGGLGQDSALFLNNGDGTFADATGAWGIALAGEDGSSVSVGDVDGDGLLDLYAGTLHERNYLYMNTGAAFIENAGPAGVEVNRSTFGAAFGDVDLDGDLDLYVVEWTLFETDGKKLFVNDGSGSFTDATDEAGLDVTDQYVPFSPAIIDLNGDRHPEIAVAADFATSHYFVNHTDGTFSALSGNGTCTDENGMGSTFGDYDNDGDLDWFVTSIYDEDGISEGNWGITGNRLYRNEGGHFYTDATDLGGVRNGYWGWGTSFADLNVDGFLDLVMTNGFATTAGSNPDPDFNDDPSLLWINSGQFTVAPVFNEVAAAAGVTHTGMGKGLITFDYDNDGDLDIVITTNQDALVLYRNDTDPPPGTWLEMDLVAPPGNAPDGFGARVVLTTGTQTLTRVVHGGMTFMSQEPARLHFGFPDTPLIDTIQIRWPDGTTTSFWNVPPGQIITVGNGDSSGDGIVGIADLLDLLANWGCPAGPPCVGDLNHDGLVNIIDLLILLANWS